MVKVSVVIPVYNVEDFLAECLDSIVNQTFTDIEIICVNDGSTDGSLEILNEYAQRDERFTVISQENAGHAVATNRGMELAKGEYLFLMDSDDILKLNAFEDTVKVADEKDVDFVIFQAINYYMDTNEYKEQENYSMNKLADHVGDSVFNWKDIKEFVFKIAVTPWSKLYKREFVENCGAKFPEGLIFDDNVFFWEVLFNAERIAFHRQHLFIRRWHSASSTKAGDIRFIDSIEIYRLIWAVFKKYGVFEEFKEELYNRRVRIAYYRLSAIRPEFRKPFLEEFKKSMDEIRQEEFFDDFYESIDERNRKIFDLVEELDDPSEVIIQVCLFDIYILKKKNRKLRKKNKKLKKENKEILNSNSWKLTKSLRSAKNMFK
jgi:glycosyltransferase involved in cell wall biosynthesis